MHKKNEPQLTQAVALPAYIRHELHHLCNCGLHVYKTQSACINGSRFIHDQLLAFVLVVIAIAEFAC